MLWARPCWALLSLSIQGGEFWYSPAARNVGWGLQGEHCGWMWALGGKLVPQFLPFCICSLSSRDGKATSSCSFPYPLSNSMQRGPLCPAPACCGAQHCPTKALMPGLCLYQGCDCSWSHRAAHKPPFSLHKLLPELKTK